jgi:ubiquinone/menaquinone biosynthesis C-methylase UbiE
MKLGKIEKWFINRETHSKKVIERAERLLKHIDIKPGHDLLEIGCGSGPVSNHISKKYMAKVVGTDVDEDQITLARNNSKDLKNVTFMVSDATDLPFKNKSFDIVLSINVLHHISNWMDALKEINRVLRNGGYLVLAELLFTKWSQGIGRLYSKQVYGITTMENLDSFTTDNRYSTIHSRLAKSLMWDNLEVIYKK